MLCLNGKLSLLLLLGLLVIFHFEKVNASSSEDSDADDSDTDDEEGCVDLATNCRQLKNAGLCNNRIYQNTMNTYCRDTCNVCGNDNNNSNSNNNQANCQDTSGSCFNWDRNGFCNSAFYTRTQKKTSCRKTCNLC